MLTFLCWAPPGTVPGAPGNSLRVQVRVRRQEIPQSRTNSGWQRWDSTPVSASEVLLLPVTLGCFQIKGRGQVPVAGRAQNGVQLRIA